MHLSLCINFHATAQINADQVLEIGKNALYFEDYVVAIQYFNQAISTKPYLAKPYFYRALAKLHLEDFHGAADDAGRAIELNEFITGAYEIRAVSRQQLGDDAGSIGDYEHALSLSPRNRQLMFNLALAYSHVDNFNKADSVFTEVLSYYPGFEEAFLGRSDMLLQKGDTLRALTDLDSALVINPNSIYGNLRRAEVLMNRSTPLYRNALVNMDRAVKLDPKNPNLYINRAVIRYNLDDWWGAKEDLNMVLELDPNNEIARLNRAILNLEANSNDEAQEDLTIILRQDPDNYRARYNRAAVRFQKRNYKGAIEDITQVLKRFPDYAAGYLWRSDMHQQMGNYTAAQADFEQAEAISRKLKAKGRRVVVDLPESADERDSAKRGQKDKTEKELTAEELTEKEFTRLLTADDNTDLRSEYTNTAARGRVQDMNRTVEPEPMVELAFYTSPTEVSENSYYIREVDELNRTRQLNNVVFATVNPPQLYDDEAIANHFASIDYFNSYLATHTPRAVDYLGRALNFVTVRDYASAIRDIDRALALNPDYAPAYMLRAQSRMRLHKAQTIDLHDYSAGSTAPKIDAQTRRSIEQKTKDDILADIDKAIELSPSNPYLYYNKAVAQIEFDNPSRALENLNRALELDPSFAPAYYNRGYVLLESGQKEKGLADLSRAGELGVVAAYNLIKRISNR